MAYNIMRKGRDDMYEEFFIKRLALLREIKGVSAREMSLAIGQNESYINRIENGKSFPSMQVFFYICEYLGVTPMDFFNENVANPKQLAHLVDKLCGRSQAQLDLLEQLLEQFQ